MELPDFLIHAGSLSLGLAANVFTGIFRPHLQVQQFPNLVERETKLFGILANIVRARIRRDEVFARYGGEEFAIILPETSLEGAVALAETLRQKVGEHLFVFQADAIRVTISIGAALLQESDRAATELIKRADEKLYVAKNSGRNRVCS